MEQPNNDYSQYVNESSEDKLELLRKYADQLKSNELLIAGIGVQLEDAKKENKRISEELILPLMDELKIQDFRTTYGFFIEAKEEMRASISKENTDAAHGWLRSTGNGGVIKNKLEIEFKRNEDNIAKSLAAELSEKGFDVEQKESVHYQTLNSLIKEKLTKGEEVDQSITIFRQRVLITEEKKKSKKAK